MRRFLEHVLKNIMVGDTLLIITQHYRGKGTKVARIGKPQRGISGK